MMEGKWVEKALNSSESEANHIHTVCSPDSVMHGPV